MEPVTSYGNVQIFQTVKDHYYYFVNPGIIRNKESNQIIDVLLGDDHLEEIMFIGEKKPLKVYHGAYGMCNTNIKISESEAEMFISNVAVSNNKTLNFKNPLLDAILSDGSRMNATIPPASVDGSTFTIRKFKKKHVNVLDLIRSETISDELGAFLWTCIEGLNAKPANIIFSGGTSSGKTTNLNALSMFIPFDARIVSIEDTPELQILHDHLVRLNAVADSKVDMNKLVVNSLRMRPDRIIVGEVRGEEALSLFTAMNTGHEGCMGTLHANTTQETLNRITQDPMKVPVSLLNGLDLIVMQQRTISGRYHYRHITEVAEVISNPSGNMLPKTNSLFKFNPARGKIIKTGIPSRIREKISKAAGISTKNFDDIIKKRGMLLSQALKNNYNLRQISDMIISNLF